MALILKDRVQETTTTTGTGTLTLGGAVTGYQSFSAIGNANTTYYAIYANGGSEWEVGIGTYTASGTTLSRTTVLSSSNSGSLVSFSAGTKNVWCDYPAGKAVYTDTSGNVANYTITGGTINGTAIGGTTAGDGTFDILTGNTSRLGVATGTSMVASNGLSSTSTFSGTPPTDGIVVDYSTGYGRFSAFTGDGYQWYTGGVGTTKIMDITSAGALTTTGTVTANGVLLTGNLGTVTSVTGTSPVVSSGGNTPAISMPAATTSVNGYLTSTDWNTFNNKGSGTVTSVSATAPITSSGGTTPNLAMPAATTSVSGYLTSTDWTTFNNKGSGTVTSVTGTAPVVSSGGATPAISMAAATTSVNGYLTSTDWTTFNGKAPAVTYTTTYVPFGQGTTTPNLSSSFTYTTGTGSLSAPTVTSSNGIFSTPNGNLGAGNATRFKNRIINGNMAIDQRNAGASLSASVVNAYTYSLDRWQYFANIASKFTIQQTPSTTETGYATRVAAGFTNYLATTVGASANVTVAATDSYLISQFIEGLNVSDLAWGTSSAKTVTLSAWVYSSLTGTFGGSIVNGAGNRSYPFTYSIPTANTWTQISITIAGDTTGTWLTTNGIGVRVYFSLGTGTTYSGTAGAWAATSYFSATGATNVISTNSATFYITGVQLEVGSSATGFEYVDYTTQLIMCQRYYESKPYNIICQGAVTNANAYYLTCPYAVAKRTLPTLVYTFNGGTGFSGTISTVNSGLAAVTIGDVASGTFTGSLFSIIALTASAEL